jgi:hypothetical protein
LPVNTTGWFAPKNLQCNDMNKKLQSFDGLIPAGQSPEIRQPHLVQCENSLCLAFLDKSGKWKSFSNNRELTDFVKVCAG